MSGEALRELPAARVVVVEYNSTIPPSDEWVVAYDAAKGWNRTNYFGASLKSYELLGRGLGYVLVGCGLAGTNAFFVREELAADQFRAAIHGGDTTTSRPATGWPACAPATGAASPIDGPLPSPTRVKRILRPSPAARPPSPSYMVVAARRGAFEPDWGAHPGRLGRSLAAGAPAARADPRVLLATSTGGHPSRR